MPKILITGAAGFVASHLISLLSSDFEIIGAGREPSLDISSIKYFPCDIINSLDVTQLITQEQPEFIVHLAAQARTHSSETQSIFQTNFIGTLNLYEAVRSLPNYTPKILFVSSSEVYGQTDTPDDITEDCLLNPTNLYGVSKLAADRLSYQYAIAHNLNIIILRPFPHTGPGQQPGFFVPDIAYQIAQAEKNSHSPQIDTGNLTAIRDYTDVRDIAQAYRLALITDLPSGEAYNLSSHAISIQSLLDDLLAQSTVPLTIRIDSTKLRSLDIPIHIGNHHKFSQATGWQPQISIHQTLEDTLNYYRNL